MAKKRFAVFLAMALIMALSACSGTGGAPEPGGDTGDTPGGAVSEDKNPAKDGGNITLRVLNMPANTSGVMQGWFTDYLKEQLGNIDLDYLPTGDQGEQKLQALMASGELPDLVVFKDNKQVENAVAGDMLLAYDDYKDLVPNLYNNAGMSMQYYADNISLGKNKTYAVGVGISNAVEKIGDRGSPFLRYDIYKEIGAPEIKTYEDYLPVIKQMQDAEPTNADGKKVYGFSIWKDWDRAYMTVGMFTVGDFGITIPGEASLAQIDHLKNDEITSILDESSGYMRFLKFYYNANQMGLLDPDSMTQRVNDATQKSTDGRVLFMPGGWGTFFPRELEDQGIGFKRVPSGDVKVTVDSLNLVGTGWSVSVGKATKYPQECMKVVNFIYDYDTAMVEKNGPKGSIWEYDESGKPYVTSEGYKWYTEEHDIGAALVDPYSVASINMERNIPFHNMLWEKADYAPAESVLTQTWQKDYGAKTILEYHYAHNSVVQKPYVINPVLTDEMEQISARVGDVIKTNSWKMIFAANEAEYEALKDEMIKKATGLGIDKYVDWFRTEYENSKTFSAKYVK